MTELEQLVRDDLHRATADLDIEVDAAAILTRHHATGRRRVWTWVALGAAGLAFGLTAWSALGGLSTVIPGIPDPNQTPAPILSGSPAPLPSTPAGPDASSTPTLNPVPTVAAAIYFMDAQQMEQIPENTNKWVTVEAEDFDGTISRESRQVTAATPVRGALEAMIAGPTSEGLLGLWPTGTRVLGISVDGDVITVDLSGEARQATVMHLPIGAASEVVMMQSLVWTVTSAYNMPDAAVQLRIDGAPAGAAWGHANWDAPVRRAEALGTLSRVIIGTPRWNETVGSPVHVSGEAAVFEATLEYAVYDVQKALDTQTNVSDHQVAWGTTMTAEGQRFAPFSFDLALGPGRYSLVIREPDYAGLPPGEGPQPPETWVNITVR